MNYYYSYEAFKNDTIKLIQQVQSFKAEAIVGVARGGLSLSHAVAEGLELRDVETLRTELYDSETKREKISLFGRCEFKNIKRVLVLDDIADSGETLQAVMEFLKQEHPSIEFRAATLFYKETSVYEPDYWVREAKEWIDFFWERDFKV